MANLDDCENINNLISDKMLASPYGIMDPRLMQFMPTSEDSKMNKRQQPMMMINPYEMVNDRQRQLQMRMLQMQTQNRTHSMLQQHVNIKT